MLEYLNKNNLNSFFNFINIDKINDIPDNITIVPTILDTVIENTFEGKKAFEYIINQKYFYHPTNNINLWINNTIPKPIIEEDKKAIDKHNFNFSSIELSTTIEDETIQFQKINNVVIKDKKTLALLKLRKH
jgi:hypothetical protein